MNFPLMFVWFIIAIFIFRHHLKKSSRAQEDASKKFWAKEESSLVVRKQVLDPGIFIHPHLRLDDLTQMSSINKEGLSLLSHQLDQLKDLIDKPMVNLKDMTNADIRLKYGTANLTLLEAYENNYLSYTNLLFQIGKTLLDLNHYKEAVCLLDEALQIGSDNRLLYLALADYYLSIGNSQAFDALYDKASNLTTLTKDALMKALNEKKTAFS